MSAATALVLSGPRLADGRVVDVRIGGERIEAVGTAGSLAAPPPARSEEPGAASGQSALGAAHPGADPPGPHRAVSAVDLSGYVLLPAPAEPHSHLDTALTAGPGARTDLPDPGIPGTTADPWHRSDPSLAGPGWPSSPAHAPPARGPREVRRRMTEAALLQLGHGATAQRTHIRIGDIAGLRMVEAALDTRRALRGLADLSVVAVPRMLTGRAGADARALLHDAAKMGATALGCVPDLDPDPAGCLDILLEIAAEHGTAVDLHTDGDDPARMARLAAATGGLRTGVVIGPCTGLSRMSPESAGRTADRLAAAEITVTCLPQGRCGLLAPPAPASPFPRPGATPVRLLRAAGVRVAAGSGALRDAANPVGRGDPLEAAYLLATHGEADARDAYTTVSDGARGALGLGPVRVEAGFPAELLAVRGESLDGALSLSYSRIVVHRGRVVARTSAFREYCDGDRPPSGRSRAGAYDGPKAVDESGTGGAGAGRRGPADDSGTVSAPGAGGPSGDGGGTVYGDGVVDMPRQVRDRPGH